MTTLYVIGSLRNPRITEVGNALRAAGYNVFEDWHAGGPSADDEWQRYEKERGRGYKEALAGYHAQNIFNFDLVHLNRAEAGVLVMPAGRSGHIEFGYLAGQNKPVFVLFDEEPSRYDIMHQFATAICFNIDELVQELDVFTKRAQVNRRSWNADR